MQPNQPLSPLQDQVLALIVSGATAAAAAREAGVHRNTVANWLQTVEFRMALRSARFAKALFFQDQSESLAAEAIAALRAVMADPGASHGVRVRAAIAMLNRAAALAPQPPESTESDDQNLENTHKTAQNCTTENKIPAPDPHPPAPPSEARPKTGRNEVCPCGSGLKFKRCCLGKVNFARSVASLLANRAA